MIELAVPLLSASSGFLGAAVMGYRAARRVKSVRKAIKARIAEKKKDRETLDELAGVVAAVKSKVSPDFDLAAEFEKIKAKLGS